MTEDTFNESDLRDLKTADTCTICGVHDAVTDKLGLCDKCFDEIAGEPLDEPDAEIVAQAVFTPKPSDELLKLSEQEAPDEQFAEPHKRVRPEPLEMATRIHEANSTPVFVSVASTGVSDTDVIIALSVLDPSVGEEPETRVFTSFRESSKIALKIHGINHQDEYHFAGTEWFTDTSATWLQTHLAHRTVVTYSDFLEKMWMRMYTVYPLAHYLHTGELPPMRSAPPIFIVNAQRLAGRWLRPTFTREELTTGAFNNLDFLKFDDVVERVGGLYWSDDHADLLSWKKDKWQIKGEGNLEQRCKLLWKIWEAMCGQAY